MNVSNRLKECGASKEVKAGSVLAVRATIGKREWLMSDSCNPHGILRLGSSVHRISRRELRVAIFSRRRLGDL